MDKDIKIDLSNIGDKVEKYYDKFFTPDVILSLGISLILLLVARLFSGKLKAQFQKVIDKTNNKSIFLPVLRSLKDLTYPITGLILFGLFSAVSISFGIENKIPSIVNSLFIAWVVISFTSSLMGSGVLVQLIKFIVLVAVFLNIIGLLDPVISFLQSIKFGLQDDKVISLYAVLKGVSLLIILLWLTFFVSDKIENKISRSPDLTPSIKVLISKIIKITLFVFTVLIGLMAIGLDLTVFTVFGGAIGVGVGFGLQKIISNFISGIILLSERSIKPGDVIAIGDTYGWVNSLRARYVSVITRDGKEHLIPNELLITEKVENWSFSNDDIRVRVPFGVSYNSDIPKVMELAMQSVDMTDRVLKKPEPKCLLTGYGDSSVNFELRIWVNDPANGIGNVTSDVLFNLWNILKENNIEIPFPQRDLHIISDNRKKT